MLKKPLRTYQRKKTAKSAVIGLGAPVLLIDKHEVETDRVENSLNDSLNDPFETTFDRIAKGAVIPPRPPDEYQNSSWHSSSDSDTNINNKSQKFCEPISPNFPVCNNTSKIRSNIKTRERHGSSTKCKRKVVTSNKTMSKRTRTTLGSNIQEKGEQPQKAQARKKQASRTRRNKRRQLKESRSLRDKERLDVYSDASILEDVTKKTDVSCNSGKKYSDQSTSATGDETSSHNGLMGSAWSNADSKYVSSSCIAKDSRPCFVKLIAVQHTLPKKKSLKDKRDSHTTGSCANDSETDKNSLTTNKTDAQSISKVKDDDAVRNLKRNLFKSCFVVLDDNVVKSWILKNKRSVNSVIAAEDEEENSSETAVRNSGTFINPYVTRSRNNLVKTSPASAKQARETVNEVDAASTKKRQSIISSTPINKRVRLDRFPVCSVLLSPINGIVFATPHSHVQTNVSLDISNIASSAKFDQEDFRSPNKLEQESDTDVRENKQTQISPLHTTRTRLIENSFDERFDERSERDISNIVSSNRSDDKDFCPSSKLEKEPDTDVHEKQTQILVLSPQTRVNRDCFVKLEKKRLENDEIYTAPTQKLDKAQSASACSLSALSANTDRSRSLFSDTTINYSIKSATEDDDQTSEYLLEKHSLESSNARTTFGNSIITRTKVKCKNETRKNQSMSQSATDVSTNISENFENKIINETNVRERILDETDGARVMLAKLEDPVRVTARRTQYAKWQLSMSDIFESLINDSAESSKVSAVETTSAIKSEMNCLEAAVNNSCDNDDKVGMERIFLKSGKHWARSLSILTNINNEENLDKMSVGKGKKWRSSVRDVLDMQKQGLLQIGLRTDKDVTNLSCSAIDVFGTPSLDANKCVAINPTNHVRLSKRISIRVVPNKTNAKCDTKDASFLKAFGISHREKYSVHNPISDRKSARNVVLQRCSQTCYLPFSKCFPDSYLEHCHKIGEGVYGEVFLYEHNGTKSVLKIIPIEGKEAVNGEPQKKFNEILSEIVIAKELANLKSNSTCRTDGFVDVKSVNCIIGKYPEKLVELWNIYDDNKRSDNDCPSMFSENQLYVTLELSHGGQDLEAFVFQTAEEAYAVFLQIAFALAVGEKALEFEHRDLHWGNVLISRTKEPYVYYNLSEKNIKLPSKGMKASIIDFTLSRMSYAGYCIYNDLAIDPALFTAYGDYQFEIYRLMRDKIGNNWQKFEPYTNVLWLHYTLDKMITAVRYKKKNLKIHKNAIAKMKKFKDMILQYNSTFDFVNNSVDIEFMTIAQSV